MHCVRVFIFRFFKNQGSFIMINRRHIRVKVMQSVYAMFQSHSTNLDKEEKFLKQSIEKLFDLYVVNFQLLQEVKLFANKKIELSKKKILATQEDLQPNTKFINNKVLKTLSKSSSLNEYTETHKLNFWKENDEYVRIIYAELIKSDIYKVYMNSPESSFNEDKQFIIDFFKQIIAPNEKLADFFEDLTISWVDDIPFVNTWVLKTLQKTKDNKPFVLGSLYKDDDDRKFVLALFRKVMLNHHKYEENIRQKTPNWETERIAEIDMILIKMAITEFLHFPSIPGKVSINEYIELAKDYSTSKSGYFVNGVLDKLSKLFLKSNEMIKTGRGLL